MDGMEILLAVGALGLVSVAGSIVYAAKVVVGHTIDPPATAKRPVDAFDAEAAVDVINVQLENLQLAVSEGIAHTKRHEKRVQKTVTSARRLIREAGLEHAGIEAEHDELQPPDAEGIEPLPAVPTQVEGDRTVRIPGGELTIGAA